MKKHPDKIEQALLAVFSIGYIGGFLSGLLVWWLNG